MLPSSGELTGTHNLPSMSGVEVPDHIKQILDKLRCKFRKRSAGGSFPAMMRTLRIYDKNHDGKLSYEEFFHILENFHLVEEVAGPAALRGLGQPSRRLLKVTERFNRQNPVPGLVFGASTKKPTDAAAAEPSPVLTRAEADQLFDALDKDGSGFIDIPEFMRLVKPPLMGRRLDVVKLAFQILDTDGDGEVSVEEMAAKYDFSRHPEVINGLKTEDEALREFMHEWWDKNSDGRITFKEFCDYYQNISVTIDSDDYFELMVRNAWRIAGGSNPLSSCTTTLRALVYYVDGTTGIVEVKNSLGLKRWDTRELERRLIRQGVKGMKRAELVGTRIDI